MDPATAALIARMQAEDANSYGSAYADAIGTGDSDSGDSDYGAPKRRKSGKQKKPAPGPSKLAAGRKRALAVDGEAAVASDGGDANARAVPLPGGRRKRKDAGGARVGARGWTDDEKAAFEAGLAELGRDWKGIAKRIGSRDARAVASHAQKYLVKLAVAGVRVPPKVAETGEGYTLSGRPLDPYSAAARAYGLKPDVLDRLLASGADLPGLALPGPGDKENASSGANGGGGSKQGVEEEGTGRAADEAASPSGDEVAAEAAQEAADKAARAPAKPAPKRPATKLSTPKPSSKTAKPSPAPKPSPKTAKPAPAPKPSPKAAKPAPAPKASPKTTKPAPASSPVTTPADDGTLAPRTLTEYAKARPRRQLAPKTTLGATTESLDLLPLSTFVGEPGSGALAQPFTLGVSPRALAVMDLHAHLCGKEVIGLLGGSWDSTARALRATHAFPCARAAGSLSGTSVELDPEAEVQARASMDARGLAPVGWYHSHPIFVPVPSQKDADNQRNYQALFRCPQSGLEPFVGAIVAPYDTGLSTPAAATSWFVVASRGGDLAPFGLRTHADPPLQADADLEADLLDLARSVAGEPDRLDLGARWRVNLSARWHAAEAGCSGEQGATGLGDGTDGSPLTKGRKALLSLSRHLAPGAVVADLLAKVATALGLAQADVPNCGADDDEGDAAEDEGGGASESEDNDSEAA